MPARLLLFGLVLPLAMGTTGPADEPGTVAGKYGTFTSGPLLKQFLEGPMAGLDEIAQHLYVSPYTVKSHRRNIRKKLNLRNSDKDLRGYLRSKFDKQGVSEVGAGDRGQ